MTDMINISRADIIKLCKLHGKVVHVRIGDTMDEIDHSIYTMNCRLFKEHQESIGVEVINPKRLDHFVAALAPES